jgi:hypothetical protein
LVAVVFKFEFKSPSTEGPVEGDAVGLSMTVKGEWKNVR